MNVDIHILPNEMIILIFEYLQPKEVLLAVRFSCKRFLEIADEQHMWEKIVHSTLHQHYDRKYERTVYECYDLENNSWRYNNVMEKPTGINEKTLNDIWIGCGEDWKNVYFFLGNLAYSSSMIGAASHDKNSKKYREEVFYTEKGANMCLLHQWIFKDEYDDFDVRFYKRRRGAIGY